MTSFTTRCTLALSLLLLCTTASRAAEPAPRVLFMIGETEYKTKMTLPAFAKSELEPRGVECVFVHVDPDDPDNFPGIEKLADADLLFLSVRRRTPPAAQFAVVRKYLESGHPLVGIRTASHAWDRRMPPAAGKADWPLFDDEVLGMDYHGHYSNWPPKGQPTLVKSLAAQADHPILRGIPSDEFRATSHLYKYRNPAKSVTVLMTGRIAGQNALEPVAWTNTYHGGRVFYTSLGNPDDFQTPQFRTMLTNAVFWALGKKTPE